MTYIISKRVSGRLYGGNPVRNTIIGVVVSIAVIIGGGVAYTYFFGPQGTIKPPVDPATLPAKPGLRKPITPSPNTPASASVTMITSPEKPGQNASATIKTVAGSDCKIVLAYGTKAATDSGLVPKKADDYGAVEWTWTVPADAPAGSWPITVTCVFNGRSAVVQSNLVVPAP